jgi:hypothetical protein
MRQRGDICNKICIFARFMRIQAYLCDTNKYCATIKIEFNENYKAIIIGDGNGALRLFNTAEDSLSTRY